MNNFLSLLIITATLFGSEIAAVNLSLKELEGVVYETPSAEEIKIPKNIKLIIIAFEKDISAVINEYLDTKDSLYLLSYNAVFIADVHKMPKIIAKIVALPRLQKYKHPIYLYYGDKLEAIIPTREAKATLLYIEDEKVKEIRFVSTKEELKMAIEG
ncbi:hypothetical protein [Sulfurimonas denitrificans]|jgi:hypothetical protein|nr:hypothetical protein [Sulfurimonas denitrificans]MDD3442068.1 hypothetical protein [Sulfurimonas denitrificans]